MAKIKRDKKVSLDALALHDAFIMKRIISLFLMGLSRKLIAKELSVSESRIAELTHSPEFLEQLKNESDYFASLGKDQWRSAIVSLIPQAIKVLKQHLKDGNLEAVKIVMKAVGGEKDMSTQIDSNITVILPCDVSSQKQVIEIQSRDDSKLPERTDQTNIAAFLDAGV